MMFIVVLPPSWEDNNIFQSTNNIDSSINTKNVVSTLDSKTESKLVEVSTDNKHYQFKLDKNMVDQTANVVKDILTDYGSGLAKNRRLHRVPHRYGCSSIFKIFTRYANYTT